MRRHTQALVGLATVLPCLASAAETPVTAASSTPPPSSPISWGA